jgi:hypothetical protein
MACAQFKLYLGDEVATTAQLARFETITVEQEMDMSWTAHLEVPLRMDAKGRWTDEDDRFLEPMSRLRLEVSLQGGPYIPLIDGPIITVNYDMHMEPGRSMARLEVQDDGFLLHRDESVNLYEGITDDNIAQQIYDDCDDIHSTDIDSVDAPADVDDNTTVMRGTQMELLQMLARRQNMHAFVLPGDDPHTSIGCFKNDSTEDSGLPPMILTGDRRNLLSVRFSSNASMAAVYRTGAVTRSDADVNDSTANLSDITRLGTDPPSGSAANRMLRPGSTFNVNLASAVRGASQQAAFALHAEGEVLKDTYSGVLKPYQNVQVLGANGRLSGLWMIRQVTHTLSRNSYGQTFSLKRDARSAGTGKGAPAAPASVL